MDQVYIDALITQSLGAYRAGGQENLDRWLNALPAPHRTEFETCCKERLQEAIEAMKPVGEADDGEIGLTGKEAKRFIAAVLDEEPPTKDPRKRHRRDRRRTKPL